MALCKDLSKIRATTSAKFDETYKPGHHVLYEGIYVCVNCRFEVVGVAGKPLPDSRRIPHFEDCAGASWRLLIALAAR